MAGIDQISATYLPAEDRLLLRISSQAGEEFRFLLTRRVVAGLIVAFARTVDSWAETLTPEDIPGREALRDFRREQLTSQGDFARAYDPTDKSLPLGEAAVLVGGVNIQLVSDGAVLNLGLADGRSLRLQLDVQLFGGFHRLLGDSARKADWQLDLPASAPETAPAAAPLIQ